MAGPTPSVGNPTTSLVGGCQHQKHSLRGTPGLQSVFEELGYDDAELRESPAAAKLNGYAAGHDIGGELGTALERRAGPQ